MQFSGSVTSAVSVTIGGDSNAVNLAVSGMPAGADASLDVTSFTASGTANLALNLTNVASGQYELAITASGGADYRLPMDLTVAPTWNGAASNQVISDPGNWEGGTVPGPSDLAVFGDAGALPDDSGTNVVVASDFEVGALRFKQGNTRNHNIEIQNGATLSATDPGGFYHMRDELPTPNRSYIQMFGSGSFVVSNTNATFAMLNANQQESHLFMENLNEFAVDVNRVGIGDFAVYPNYYTNGNNTYPRRFVPFVHLARTNFIRTSYVADENTWTNTGLRDYAFVYGRNERQGTSADLQFWLGNENVFQVDSILWIGVGAQADNYQSDSNPKDIQFNPDLEGAKSITFRGPGGGNERVRNFTISDSSSTDDILTSGTKTVMDLSGGTVDAMIDLLILSRDRKNVDGANNEARITMDAGVLDVNTAYLGYQQTGNAEGVERNYCRGRVEANGTSLFRVNDILILGYTTADPGDISQAEQGYGQLQIDGGTAEINSITVGGVTKVSVENNISVTGGGTLAITNTAGAADAKINNFTMTDSTLVLHADGAVTDPYVYVTTLNTSGSSNILKLGAVTGLTSDPQTVKLISYESAAPNFSLELPPGLYGYVDNDTIGMTINAIITTNPPKNLVWDGNVSGDWNTSTANWQGGDLFFSGDSVRFDDSATGPNTTINVAGTVAVGDGGVVVSNATKSYTFAGAGLIAGTSTMIKDGTGSLTIDGASQLPLTINEGEVNVTALGSSGLATVGDMASLSSAGSINGLVSAGAVDNSGTIVAYGANITGGLFNNSGTVNGPINVSAASATNTDIGTIDTTGVSTIAADGVLVNNGMIINHSGRLRVDGLLTGTGTVQDSDGFLPSNPNAGNDGRLEIAGDAMLSPGNDSIGIFNVWGRFDLDPNANLLIEVEVTPSATNHDIVAVDYWGAIRGNIIMTNIGAMPFAPGQSFLIVSNNFGNLNDAGVNQNADFKFTPPSPGPGMLWDGSNLFTNGIASIKAIPSTPTDIVSSVSSNQLTMQWDPSYVGWELQQQIRALTNGISTFATNWTKVTGSDLTNEVVININPNTPAAFYRLAHPQFN